MKRKKLLSSLLIAAMAAGTLFTGTGIETKAEMRAIECGDIDLDGKVTLKDAQTVLKAALAIVQLKPYEETLADVDSDTKVTLKDAQMTLKRALSIINSDNWEVVYMNIGDDKGDTNTDNPTGPAVDVATQPAVDVTTEPAVEVTTRPAVDVTAPAVEATTKPAVDWTDTKPEATKNPIDEPEEIIYPTEEPVTDSSVTPEPTVFILKDSTKNALNKVYSERGLNWESLRQEQLEAIQTTLGDYDETKLENDAFISVIYNHVNIYNRNNTVILSDEEKMLIDSVNLERAKEGKYPLETTTLFQDAANIRANECIVSFSHTRPNGHVKTTLFEEAGCDYESEFYGSNYGENIAKGHRTVTEVMTGWMNSEGHKANILKGSYEYIGVAKAVSEDGTNYWVQIFR